MIDNRFNVNDSLSKLSYELMHHISEYLTPEDESKLRQVKPALTLKERESLRVRGISPSLTTFFIVPQRTANYLVLTGRPEHLIHMLNKDPTLFFEKYEQIIDAAGQTFYNVSPADLISFICDDDMQMQVYYFAQHLPPEQRETFFAQWQAQIVSRGRGGADLVMVPGAHPPQYANICNTANTFYVFDRNQTIQRALLKNPDGVICWKSADNQLHWYYANHDTQTLEQLDIPHELQAAHQNKYDALAVHMTNMEPNTARRSSNQEHALIKAIMRHHGSNNPVDLVREGIRYRQDGIDFIDTHYDFNRIVNAYLKCIGLYKNNKYREGHIVWCKELGHVQREVMWLVQRYCEINRSFYPLADDYKATLFVRSFNFKIDNMNIDVQARIFDAKSGQFISRFGLDDEHSGLAIYKLRQARATGFRGAAYPGAATIDFIAVNRLIVDSTQNIAKFIPEVSVSISPGTFG